MLLQQPRDEARGVLVHLQMPRPWAHELLLRGGDLKMPHHWHMAHSSEDWTVLPSITVVTELLQGIYLAFKGRVFIELRISHPPQMGCLSIFLVPAKYKFKPLCLTFSFSSVMSLHCNTCKSQKSGFKGASDYSFWKIPYMHWSFKGIIFNHVTFQVHNPVHQLIQLPREESGLMTSTENPPLHISLHCGFAL